MSKGVLVDTTKCVGCQRCAVACKVVNGLVKTSRGDFLAADPLRPLGPDTELPSEETPAEELSEVVLNVVQTRGDVYVRRFCMHCRIPHAFRSARLGRLRRRRPDRWCMRRIVASAAGTA